MIDVIVSLFLVGGGIFTLIAGIGVLKMPDILIRMHATTKAGTLGVGLMVMSLCFHFSQSGVIIRAIGILIFLVMTAPAAAHVIGRSAYGSGIKLSKKTKNLTQKNK